jgi:hypothetical protein
MGHVRFDSTLGSLSIPEIDFPSTIRQKIPAQESGVQNKNVVTKFWKRIISVTPRTSYHSRLTHVIVHMVKLLVSSLF